MEKKAALRALEIAKENMSDLRKRQPTLELIREEYKKKQDDKAKEM